MPDSQGHQIRAGKDTFTYNLDHTLASATVDGVITSYTYDATGAQLSAVSNVAGGARSRTSVIDVNAPLSMLSLETTQTPSSATSRGFVAGPGGVPLALLTGGEVDSYLPDWLGGVAGVVSPQGESQAAYDYDPYGNTRTDGTAGSAKPIVDNPIQFTGAYQDRTRGSRYSFPARTYDPSTGRFGGNDPVPSPQTEPASSTYAYTHNRPTVLVDPSGACVRLDDFNGPCINRSRPAGVHRHHR